MKIFRQLLDDMVLTHTVALGNKWRTGSVGWGDGGGEP